MLLKNAQIAQEGIKNSRVKMALKQSRAGPGPLI